MRLAVFVLAPVLLFQFPGSMPCPAAGDAPIHAGLAVRDITPEEPMFLAGYAARRKPSNAVDQRLKVQALALRSGNGDPFVFIALDNCEVSRKFMAPVEARLIGRHGLRPGSLMVVSSHTHSAPIIEDALEVMAIMPEKDREIMRQYSGRLREALVAVTEAALQDLQPARLAFGQGQATFAINRRARLPEGTQTAADPAAPVDWDVPVLRITGTNGTVRGILFGYACHGTSIQGEGFFTVSGDYMAYAREQLEALYPGATALYMTGMGADSNPAPRGSLLDAKRHGVELAAAVIEVLNRPMREVGGDVRFAFAEAPLPLQPPPDRARLEADGRNEDQFIRRRAEKFLRLLDAGGAMPEAVPLPMSAVAIGDGLTFLNMAGEVVVDYALHFKRAHAGRTLWTIGYAYEVPCYIPSARVLGEGGYEADSSMIYYGVYGPLRPELEPLIHKTMDNLLNRVSHPNPQSTPP
ncbi:MAG TPA: hypothetical protein DCY13_13235 [Verrucomicrobiales bacterium]|nr:hypothetical protein [Verrucomicrobiales bacterium]